MGDTTQDKNSILTNSSKKEEYFNFLRNFINNTLIEDNLTPYALSRKLKCNETVIPNFLKGNTQALSSEVVVAFADYKNASLDAIGGREAANITSKVTVEKSNPIKKSDTIPDFLLTLPSEVQQSIKQIKEDVQKLTYNNKPAKTSTQVTKPQSIPSHAAKHQAKNKNPSSPGGHSR